MTALFRVTVAVLAAVTASSAAAADDAFVSFTRDVQPVLTKNCTACHKPEKKKGKLDLTTFAAATAGGENGPVVVAGKPADSALVQSVIPHGNEKPAMPEKGEPLTPAEVAVLARWVEQGAKDDSAAGEVAKPGFARPGPAAPAEPPVYRSVPVVNAVATSPDGKTLAVAGRGEVLLVNVETWAVAARLPMASPRVTSLVYSADGSRLYAGGGSPGRFGQVVSWDVATGKVLANWRMSGDTVFGLSVSPDGRSVAVGCADRTARVVALADGRERLVVRSHTDWVLGTAFSADGSKVITTGRDKSLKVTPIDGGESVDVIEPQEVGACLAKSPVADVAVVGGGTGEPRIYQVADLKPRTEKEKDPNRVKICEKVPGSCNAVAFAADGRFAVAGTGEAKVFDKDGKRVATLGGHGGPVCGIAFGPDGATVYTAGFDGKVRAFDAKTGKVAKEYLPEPFTAK